MLDDVPDVDNLPGTDGWRMFARALIERGVAAAAVNEVPDSDGLEIADDAVARAQTLLVKDLEADNALTAIAAAAELEPIDIRVLAVCAGVDLDRELQRLVGLLLHDPTASRLDVDLLARLLGPAAVGALADDGRLARGALLEVDRDAPMAAARITVPRRVAWSLLGDMSLDPELPLGAEILVKRPQQIGLQDLVLVSGHDRVRRVQAAVTALAGLAFLITPPPADEAGWRVLVRQATVGGLGIVLEPTGAPDALARYWIERADHLAFALCTREPMSLDMAPSRPFAEVRAADPEVLDAEWLAVFPDAEPPSRRPTAEELRLAAAVRQPGDDPQRAVRRVASGSLMRHARRVVPSVGWSDLVLPPPQERQLRGLVDRYRSRPMVHEQWGLPLYPSPGVVALFAGPSGTGKTTAAEVIAGELAVDLFRVDLSALVSKYIGETEKNLEEIFSAAHSGDYLLLFDEADALFGSRSKVTDARDRYANMEISYLLQRLESYDGFVVLTSNFQGNIDPAFLRRIHVTVFFAVPTEQDRQQIWEHSLAGAPRDGIDLEFVAKKFDLSGGSIRLAALSAAFLAANRGKSVGMAEVLQGVNQELAKLRRRATDDQFGQWLPEVTGNLR